MNVSMYVRTRERGLDPTRKTPQEKSPARRTGLIFSLGQTFAVNLFAAKIILKKLKFFRKTIKKLHQNGLQTKSKSPKSDGSTH